MDSESFYSLFIYFFLLPLPSSLNAMTKKKKGEKSFALLRHSHSRREKKRALLQRLDSFTSPHVHVLFSKARKAGLSFVDLSSLSFPALSVLALFPCLWSFYSSKTKKKGGEIKQI